MYLTRFYDIIIFGFLFLSGIGALGLTFFKNTRGAFLKKNKKILLLSLTLLYASWLTIFYGSFIEPRFIVASYYEYETKKINAPIRAILISDTHVGPIKDRRFVERLAEKTDKENPDMVILLGDYLADDPAYLPYLDPLLALTKKYPVFAVMGNHDYLGVPNQGQIIASNSAAEEYLLSQGARVLKNTNAAIFLKNQKIFLAGADDLFSGVPDIRAALKDAPNDAFKLILSHSPDVVFDLRPGEADLVLAGHTHGGQIRLPFIGPLAEEPTVLGRKYDRGFFMFKNTPLLITSGAGETGPRARLLVPPEIAILTIK